MIRKLSMAAGLLGIALVASPAAVRAGAPAPGPAPAQEEFNDIIRLTNNNPVTPVKVIDDRWDAVVYRIPGGVPDGIPCPADTVEGVDYAGRPGEYEKAQELKRAGKYDEAIKAFDLGMTRLKADERCQRQYFQMGKIECLAAQRKPEDIRKLVEEMLATAKDNPPRLIFDAYLKLGAAYFQARKFFPEAHDAYKRAAELFDKLEGKARSSGKGGLEKQINRYALEAKLSRIQCLELVDKLDGSEADGANMAYQVFPARAAAHPDLVAQAEIGLGRCMTRRKDYPGALKYLDELEKKWRGQKNLDPKILAGALPGLYAAMGDVYLARAGSEKKDELDHYQARWYFLKVVVQHPADRVALAHAYYGAGLVYEALSREPSALQRKLRMFETVVKEFPESPEYELASEKLGDKKG